MGVGEIFLEVIGMDNILHPSDTDVTYVSSQYGNLAFSDAVGFTQYGIDNDMSFEQGGWTTPNGDGS